MTRGNLWSGLLLVALGALSCGPAPALGPGPAPDQAAPGAPAAAPAEADKPQQGGTLVYGTIKWTGGLHPLKGVSNDILRHVGPAYESLVTFDDAPGKDYRLEFKVVPWLAESWEQSDPATYVFRLRKNVKWHDGQPFTADDAIATLQWIQDEKFPPASTLRNIASMEAPDPATLKITVRRPDATFLDVLADRNLLMVPRHGIESGVDFAKTVIGTGPYKLKSFEAGKETLWVRHGDYWQPGRPYPDALRQFWGADDAIMLAAFVTGRNDLLAVPDKRQMEAVLKQKPDAKYEFEIQDQGLVLYPQMKKAPFDDVRVRKAMHLAIDRQTMNQQITFGEGSIDPPLLPGWRKGWAIPQQELLKLPGYRQPKDQDVAEAKRLLAEAGYPNGVRFKLIYNNEGVSVPRVSVAVEPMWKAAGLNVELQPTESAVSRKAEADGEFEVTIIPTVKANFGRLDSRYLSNGSENRNGIKDPKLDDMIERFSTSLVEEERKRLGLELQRYLLEQLYTIPTINIASGGMWQPWVRDYVLQNAPAVRPIQSTMSRWWLDQKLLPKDR